MICGERDIGRDGLYKILYDMVFERKDAILIPLFCIRTENKQTTVRREIGKQGNRQEDYIA